MIDEYLHDFRVWTFTIAHKKSWPYRNHKNTNHLLNYIEINNVYSPKDSFTSEKASLE